MGLCRVFLEPHFLRGVVPVHLVPDGVIALNGVSRGVVCRVHGQDERGVWFDEVIRKAANGGHQPFDA